MTAGDNAPPPAAHPRVAYLGPEGTFSEEAAHLHFGDGAERVACPSIREVVDRLLAGDAEWAVAPLENSRAGRVAETAESMAQHGHSLTIRDHIRLPVRHQLVTAHQGHLTAVRVVTSHPQALAQCSQFLRQHLGNARCEDATSTAAAVIRARSEQRVAAIASARAAVLYGVVIIAANIQDPGESVTIFAVLERTRR